MNEGPIVEALRGAIASATVDRTSPTDDTAPRLVAIGWATVETDRAIAELADALATDGSAFAAAPGSTVLGSYVLVADGLLDGAVSLAVVEPSAEGRLAAHLARHGEGPTIAWLAEPGPDPTDPGSDGPFGPERLLAPRPDGLLRLLVTTPPGTISR